MISSDFQRKSEVAWDHERQISSAVGMVAVMDQELGKPAEKREQEMVKGYAAQLKALTGEDFGLDVRRWKEFMGAGLLKTLEAEVAKPEGDRDAILIEFICRDLSTLTGKFPEKDPAVWKQVLTEVTKVGPAEGRNEGAEPK
jgi:hypothetical protein